MEECSAPRKLQWLDLAICQILIRAVSIQFSLAKRLVTHLSDRPTLQPKSFYEPREQIRTMRCLQSQLYLSQIGVAYV